MSFVDVAMFCHVLFFWVCFKLGLNGVNTGQNMRMVLLSTYFWVKTGFAVPALVI